MTITTAKWPLAGLLRLTPLALAAMLLSNECRADWKVTPSVNLRETYSDNINNQTDTLAETGFVSEVVPGLAVNGTGRRLKFDANAEFSRYAYHGVETSNLRNGNTRYRAALASELVDEFLFLDVSASRSRQTVSAFGPVATNGFTALNNTDVRTWAISPYLRHRFGAAATVTARFSRDGTKSGLDNYFGDGTASTRSLGVDSGAAFPIVGWNLSYFHQDLKRGSVNDARGASDESSSENVTAGLRWRLNPHLFAIASAGYDKYEYAVFNERTRGRSWTGGFRWAPSTRTSVEASFGRRYFGKTGSLDATHRRRLSTWSLGYSDAITTTRSQFLLPAAIDTASMLDRLFASTYPDPAQRAQVVQAYIAATGLPPSLTDSINYLSNRYIRVKRLQGAVAMRGVRSDLVLTVFKDERHALSLQEADSTLLPSQLSALNDNTRQRGVSADAGYRLSTRTRIQANVYAARVQSLDTGQSNNIRQVNLGLNRTLGSKASGNIGLRHSSGRVGVFNNDKYHENALVAGLSFQY